MKVIGREEKEKINELAGTENWTLEETSESGVVAVVAFGQVRLFLDSDTLEEKEE